MIKIEVTGNSIPEVADKLLAIGRSLQATASYEEDNAAREAMQAKRKAKKVDPVMPEVAEMAAVDPTPSSSPATETNTTQSSEPAPKSAATAEATESQPTTPEPSSAPVAAASASELDFDTDVAPHVLRVVKDKGKPVAEEILSQFGVVKASQLDPAQWPELVDALKAAL